MSNKDQAISLLDKVPDHKMGYAVAFLQGLVIDEEADELFCEKMVRDYINNPDPNKHDYVTLDELKAELGMNDEI